ncbi:apolipoprotein N-acyltransferase [Amycolatopsis tucumanensis]|uniref:apolipoprotein N-acyltransferase n=1 Tax=Amycolatopsis tucumanensis TaxID=401106 RepID=UPI001EFFB30B|nr:apolipoprotein N-acyltransferase [Amycolatopsis tucumanensis]MCF6429180.1 apolipoprotein N-acyltransferase [Amycolatopsis tucumanensis]
MADIVRPRLGQVLWRSLLAAASGVLLYLSFAPRPLWWLAPVAFAGLGLTLHGRRFGAGCGYGFVFGLALFLPLLSWLQDFLGADFGPWPWLALSATLALYLAVVGGLITLVQGLPAAPVWSALIVIAAETPRAWFPLGGFPWGRVAFTQPEGAFVSLASVGGAPLVGFAVVLCGFGASALVRTLRRREGRLRPLLGPVAAVLVPVLAGLSVWTTVGTEAQAGTRTVAVVQGGAPDIGLALQGQRGLLRENHLAQTRRLRAEVDAGRVRKPDLVVWPESAASMPSDRERLDAMVDEAGASVLVGALERLPDGRVRNVVIAWEPGSGAGERYAKQQLVPFGEYVPARAIARLVTPFANGSDDVVPGDGRRAALPVAGVTVGVAVCYEVAYDYPGRDAVRGGAQLLTVPTNNAWYGRSEMSYQQLAMARLRAVEHGRSVVVAATSGVSAVIRPDGTVAASTSLFTPASLVEEVPLRSEVTLSDRLGAWPEYSMLGTAAAAVLAGLLRHRQRVVISRPGSIKPKPTR